MNQNQNHPECDKWAWGIAFLFLCLAPFVAYKVGVADGYDDCRSGLSEP